MAEHEHDETRFSEAPVPAEPYTVHADTDASSPAAPPSPSREAARRGAADPIALVAGVVALAIAVLALTGQLALIDPRSVLALGALLVGGTALLVTLRRRRT